MQREGLDLLGDSTGHWRAISANLRRLRRLRSALAVAAPDAIVSFVTRTNILALATGAARRTIVSERIDPRQHREGFIWDVLRALTYRRARALVVQTAAIAAWYRARWWSPARISVIPNPVERSTSQALAPQAPHPYVLGAGRLVAQKGFDLLIHAFSGLAATMPALQLVIAGEGPERARLEGLATQLGLQGRIHLPGQVGDLAGLMQRAEAFVLSSRYEGFPNVLLEALAAGTACVATDCPDGPRDILDGGRCGLLVPVENVAALTAAMQRLLSEPGLRATLTGRSQDALARYAPGRVLDAWEQLLDCAP